MVGFFIFPSCPYYFKHFSVSIHIIAAVTGNSLTHSLPTLLFLLIFPISTIAQNTSEWTPYTSFRTVQDLTVSDENEIWVSTLGGVFTISDGVIDRKLTTIDGLYRLDARAIVYDNANDRVIIGYNDGGIDVLNPDTGEITFLGDILRADNFSPRGINDFLIEGNNLYVATDFGIVNYDLINLFVTDSYTKLGILNRGLPVNDISIQGDSIYVATAEGIAYASMSDELEFSENWLNYNSDNGFVSEPVLALEAIEGRIFASTNSENRVLENGIWVGAPNFGSLIRQYEKHERTLIALSRNQVYMLEESGTVSSLSLGAEVGTALEVMDANTIFVGTLNEGVGSLNADFNEVSYLTPGGPYQNTFIGLNFVDDILIASSSNESDRNADIDLGKGYYIFDDGQWFNYNAQNNTLIGDAGYRQAFTTTSTEDYFYFGSWGRGVARHDRLNNEIYIFDETNSSLRGWEADNPFFPVISGLDTDSNGDVWIVSRWAQNPIYYQTPGDDDWIQIPPLASLSSLDEHFLLFIDSYDQKWISLQATNLAGRGVVVMRTGDPTDPSDDEGVKLTDDINQGFLPDLQVKAIVEDRNNEIWVGTERGIGRYIFPELIIDGGADERRAQFLINEDTSAVSRILLRDVNVSSMAVNNANQKWVGSENQGLYLINAEGTRILRHFTENNSPIFSNSIRSVAVRESTGEVFIATDKGLLSFQDVPKAPVNKMDELQVYPNPFSYDRHNEIFIEGLSEESTLRVIGSDGTFIREIRARGGRISWDGRDFNGSRVGSGVYFVIALDDNGSEKGIGKVAIIR